MTVTNYIKLCKKFAKDTAEWGNLDGFQYYTTNSVDGWRETSDNSHDGIDVSWAFHLTDEEIEQQAAEQLFEQLMADLNIAVSDGWEKEDYKMLYEKFAI